MAEKPVKKNWRQRLTAWVDGEREFKDRSLFVMEQRSSVTFRRPTEEEHERREKHRLRWFLNRYPIGAGLLGLTLVAVLMAVVLTMPPFGQPDNPMHNEVAQRYLERGYEETGAENIVTAMILNYRGFDTLGESCVLFLAVAAVMILVLQDKKNTSKQDLAQRAREDTLLKSHQDTILKQAARILVPVLFLFAIYMLLNGERSPGGGFSGGTVLGAGLILSSLAFGAGRVQALLTRRVYSAVRTFGLLLYAGLYGVNIFLGANGLPNYLTGMTMLIDLAVGLVVACTIYGFFALFSRGEL